MAKSSKVQKTRDSSAEALKTVYYVIIAIAITEALSRVLLKNGTFLGWREIFMINNQSAFWLFFAFLCTICRFIHGASIHLDVIRKERYKPLIDCIGFYLQAIFFYLMAVTLQEPSKFSFSFILMLVCDTGWLLILRDIFKYIPLNNKVCKQWLKSNKWLIAIFILLYLFSHSMFQYHCSLALLTLSWSICISIAAIIATFFDYRTNKNFYFPEQ
ncbi:MAG: hypothetical protein PHS93_00465 [Candidatus Omnitrophica bacterium]|nr:hypothetical protein [Candidatus Omnitrophota bacterium]MDD5351628.1 hypothetical protein [Candidatus Omnitrophota bacterium]MDD5550838.1 hypothetical protein [Candidatus Omnitrophota bacterium]